MIGMIGRIALFGPLFGPPLGARLIVLFVVLLGVLLGAAPATAAPTRGKHAAVVDQIDRLVRANFYAPAVLAKRGWSQAVRDARDAIAAAPPERHGEILARLVAQLQTSHTEYIAPDDPRHAQILSIFGGILPSAKDRCPDLSKLPPLPIVVPDVGVWWQRIDDAWFVGGLIDGGPARAAGLVLGDEVVTANGRPFQPVAAFAAGPGTRVRLGVRRSPGAALRTITVEPRRVQPQAAFRSAITASARILERGAARIAYVRVWSWAGADMQDALEQAISELNGKRPTGFVLDLRDGWGGASPDYLRIFDPRIPVLEMIDRRGQRQRHDRHIRVPAAVLINGGSRSGKEAVAYGIKKHGLAKLVGERTGGAVVAGGVYCLDDGAVLYLASSAVTVDGEVLEGKGVAPDLAVPFDVRHAAGRDRQLDAALEALSAR
jgi:carboxyl-terminal processing protease